MFPLYYRSDLPDRALTIIGDEIMDGIKFQIGDYTLTFDESVVPYMNISQNIDEVAKPLIKELGKQYKRLGNIVDVHNQFLSIGNEALEKVAEQAVKIFSECGIYDVNANKILNATDFHVSPLNLWANYFSQIDNIYVRIEQRSIAEKDARELQKETRMRVVGGGFGLSGAAKGMVQAGAINMLTGAAYDFVNMFGDMQSDKAASKSQEALYESLDTLYTLQLGFSAATNVIKQIIFKILRIKPFEDNNVEQAVAILENVHKGNIPKENVEKAIAQALLSNPFDAKLYRAYISRFGDRSFQLERMAEFFGLLDAVREEKKSILLQMLEQKFDGDILVSPRYKYWQYTCEVLLGKSLPAVALTIVKLDDLKEQVAFVQKLMQVLGAMRDEALMDASTKLMLYSLAVEQYTKDNKPFNPSDLQGDVIPAYRYIKNKEIKSLVVPSNIHRIDEGAFAECSSLEEIIFEDGTEYIGPAAFTHCGIKRIKFPKTLKVIDEQAFANCSGLERIELPEGLTTIGKRAFDWCLISEAVVPDSVEDFGEEIFGDFWTTIICSPQAPVVRYVEYNDVGYKLPGLFTLKQGREIEGSVVIPDGCVRIHDRACNGNQLLREVTIPTSVKEVGETAFYRCTNLEKVIFKPGTVKIERQAFCACFSLKEVGLPNTLKEIGERAFDRCDELKELYVPDGGVSVAANCVYGKKLEMVVLPDSIQEIYSIDSDTGERQPFGHPDHLCHLDKYDTRFVCKPGSYAYNYCKANGLQLVEDEKDIVYETERAQENARITKEEYEAKDAWGFLFWAFVIGAIIKWLFF